METRSFPRVSYPHIPSLRDVLRPVFGAFVVWHESQAVYITADFSGTTDQAVQALVDAAPIWSAALDAKYQADTLSMIEKAAYLTLLDAINVERARHSAAAITPAQYIAQVKAKVDSLP